MFKNIINDSLNKIENNITAVPDFQLKNLLAKVNAEADKRFPVAKNEPAKPKPAQKKYVKKASIMRDRLITAAMKKGAKIGN